jgi:hypothetical protein
MELMKTKAVSDISINKICTFASLAYREHSKTLLFPYPVKN